MIRIFALYFSLMVTVHITVKASGSQQAMIPFYSEQLFVTFNPDLLQPSLSSLKEKGMVEYYHQLLKTDFSPLINDLQRKKKFLDLNDWLYYELLKKTVEVILKDKSLQEQELCQWFLLTQSGFDTRLTYLESSLFLYVYTNDEIFEVPMIKDKERTYANLTSIHAGTKSQPALYLLNFTPAPNGVPFSFNLDKLPTLQPTPLTKSFVFSLDQKEYKISIQMDRTVADLMHTYPFIAERQYLQVPLSSTLSNSLLPQLEKLIEGKTTKEALELLVAFTRSSFEYMEDKEHFGKSKPMIADEVFHYPFSDCEDRSALFYCLVKELLDLPMIIIAYPDHLTIGVAHDPIGGDYINYHGKAYYICDPTGPANSTEIGEIPAGYENVPFEIIGSYQ